MNTRYNKNRVVEEGWKNILRNVIGCKNITQSTGNDQAEEFNIPHINEKARSLRHISSMIMRCGNRNNTVEPLHSVTYHKRNMDDICIISQNQHLALRSSANDLNLDAGTTPVSYTHLTLPTKA